MAEILLVDKPKPKPETDVSSKTEDAAAAENPIKVLSQQLLSTGLLSGANSLEKLKLMEKADFFEDMLQRAIVFEPQIEKALNEKKPDLIILDHFYISPAIQRSGIPFVLIFSGNPIMCMNSTKLPPPCSGIYFLFYLKSASF